VAGAVTVTAAEAAAAWDGEQSLLVRVKDHKKTGALIPAANYHRHSSASMHISSGQIEVSTNCSLLLRTKPLTLLPRLLLLHHRLLWGIAWVSWHALRRCWPTHGRVACCCWPDAGVCCCLRASWHRRVASWLLLRCPTRVATGLVLGRRCTISARWGRVGSLRC
jgi:hypothetical protein